MKTILIMAWRNLWRNRRRTFLTMGAIGFSCAVLVFFVALQLSSYETSIRATLAVFQGHIQLQAPGYLDSPEMRESLESALDLQSKLAEVEGVTATAVRGQGFALVSSPNRSIGALIVGVQPKHEEAVSTIPHTVREGRYLHSDDQAVVVLGTRLARSLGAQVGTQLTMLGQGWDGSVAAAVAEVVGIFESGTPDVDRNFIEMPLHFFQDVFSMGQRAHAVVATVADLNTAPLMKGRIEQSINNSFVQVLDWEQLIPGLKSAIELDFIAGWLFYFTLVIIVAFTVLNTFLMTVLERTREFGVMMALGTSPRRIIALIVSECCMVTALGVGLGILLGGAVTLYFGVVGFSLPGAQEIQAHWHVPVDLHTRLVPLSLTLGPGLLVLAALVA
ncbi:MAG: ABC transporter permease, partial [Oligoflexia bacterium]|nr:ABC transporter permease [Oligoflexia bacterium]